MRLNQKEKYEIILLVEGSELGVNGTLKELGITKRTFYNWYNAYLENGYDGLAAKPSKRKQYWNKISDKERQLVIETALEYPDKSSREVACYITDTYKRYISESSVYRILKQKGLITTPAFMLIKAADEYKDKTKRVNEMWQTDFTYLKVFGWGWYYLSTIIDDYSRYIVSWKLCKTMKADDVRNTVDDALNVTGMPPGQMPKLLTDNGACYISSELNGFLQDQGIKHIHGRINHPQTQGKIERYHRSMKNVIKLDVYYTPDELKRKIAEFVYYYNYLRYHESLNNVTPADVYTGRANQIIKRRLRIKQKTLNERKNSYFKNKLSDENKKSHSFVME
jgi:putative transposase